MAPLSAALTGVRVKAAQGDVVDARRETGPDHRGDHLQLLGERVARVLDERRRAGGRADLLASQSRIQRGAHKKCGVAVAFCVASVEDGAMGPRKRIVVVSADPSQVVGLLKGDGSEGIALQSERLVIADRDAARRGAPLGAPRTFVVEVPPEPPFANALVAKRLRTTR